MGTVIALRAQCLVHGQLPFTLCMEMTEDAGGRIVGLDLEITAIFGQPAVKDLQYTDAASAEMEGKGFAVAMCCKAAFDEENHDDSA